LTLAMAFPPPPGYYNPMVQSIDKNGDGVVDPAELGEAARDGKLYGPYGPPPAAPAGWAQYPAAFQHGNYLTQSTPLGHYPGYHGMHHGGMGYPGYYPAGYPGVGQPGYDLVRGVPASVITTRETKQWLSQVAPEMAQGTVKDKKMTQALGFPGPGVAGPISCPTTPWKPFNADPASFEFVDQTTKAYHMEGLTPPEMSTGDSKWLGTNRASLGDWTRSRAIGTRGAIHSSCRSPTRAPFEKSNPPRKEPARSKGLSAAEALAIGNANNYSSKKAVTMSFDPI